MISKAYFSEYVAEGLLIPILDVAFKDFKLMLELVHASAPNRRVAFPPFLEFLSEVRRSQNFSNLNGLQGLTPTFSHSRLMGQWSDPAAGRTTALRFPPAIMTNSESRNLSCLHAIPMSHVFLLF